MTVTAPSSTTPTKRERSDTEIAQASWTMLFIASLGALVVRALMLVGVLEAPDLVLSLMWAGLLFVAAWCGFRFASTRDAITTRHVSEAILLAAVCGAFAWLFPPWTGDSALQTSDRLGLAFVGAAAGGLVAATVFLAFSKARATVSTTAFVISALLLVCTALFFQTSGFPAGLIIAIGAEAFALFGRREPASKPSLPGPGSLRLGQAIVGLIAVSLGVYAIQQCLARDILLDNLVPLAVVGFALVAALISVIDVARRMNDPETPKIDPWADEVSVPSSPIDPFTPAPHAGTLAPPDLPEPHMAAPPSLGPPEIEGSWIANPVSFDAPAPPTAPDIPTPAIITGSGQAITVEPIRIPEIQPSQPEPAILVKEEVHAAATIIDTSSPTDQAGDALSDGGFFGSVVDEFLRDKESSQEVQWGDEVVDEEVMIVTGSDPEGAATEEASHDSDSEPLSGFIPVPRDEPEGVELEITGSADDSVAEGLVNYESATAWSRNGVMLGGNAEFWSLIDREPVANFNLLSAVHPDDRPALAQAISRGTRDGDSARMAVRLIDSGTYAERWVRVAGGTFQAEVGPLGEVPNAAWQLSFAPTKPTVDRDFDFESRIESYDPETGLPNQDYLEFWLRAQRVDGRRTLDRPLLVVVEAAVPRVYQGAPLRERRTLMSEMAAAIAEAIRPSDRIVRLSGPYFVVITEAVAEGAEWAVLERFEALTDTPLSELRDLTEIPHHASRVVPMRLQEGAAVSDIEAMMALTLT